VLPELVHVAFGVTRQGRHRLQRLPFNAMFMTFGVI
jgi:hypothetical protein